MGAENQPGRFPRPKKPVESQDVPADLQNIQVKLRGGPPLTPLDVKPNRVIEEEGVMGETRFPQVKPSHSAKDQYYQEKLKYLKNKMKQDQEPKPEKKEPKYDARDDHELIARNRLANDMFQEQRRHFWKTHMKDENYPQDYW